MKDFFTSRFATLGNFFQAQQWPDWSFWKGLFTWQYWTDGPLLFRSTHVVFFLGLTLVILIGLGFWRRQLKKADQKTPVYKYPAEAILNLMVFIGVMAISYLFFRSQEVAYLSSRLVILATLLVCLVWLGYLIYYFQRIIPSKRRQYLEKERFFRYLPKKK